MRKIIILGANGSIGMQTLDVIKNRDFEVVAISLSDDNYKQLKKYCSKVYSFCPGEVQKIEDVLQISCVSF